MEPFSIVCKSCAARLKVTKASAVGQILACPKCGTMIEVTAPEGWVAPQSTEVSDSAADSASTGSLGDFEDIEQLLAKPQPAKKSPSQSPRPSPKKKQPAKQTGSPAGNVPHPVSKKRKPGQPAGATDPARPTTSAGARPSGQPVLPTDQWTSEETLKRKRLVRNVIGIAGSLLLLAAVIMAIILNFSKPEKKLASQDPQANVNNSNAAPADAPSNPGVPGNGNEAAGDLSTDTNQSATGDGSTDQAGNATQTQPANDADDVGSDLNSGNLVDDSNAGQLPSGEQGSDPNTADTENKVTQPKIGDDFDKNNPPPLKVDDPDSQGAKESTSPFDRAKPKQDQDSPFDVEPPPSKPTVQAGMVEELDNDLGELSNLLEQRGTSLSDFQDVASQINNQQLIGLPKYIVIRPDAELDVDLEKALAYPIGGLIFENTSLSKILRSISTISGIPITVDAHSIVAAGKNPNQPISIKINATDVVGALDQILAQLELSQLSFGNGIIVGSFGSQAMSKAEFDLPEIPNLSDDDRKRFVALIREFVFPQAWVREQAPATIELVENTVVVNCTEPMQSEIERLISKLKSSFALIQDPSNADALADTQSRWDAISPLLTENPELGHSLQSEIGQFLNRFESKTGVAVFVDWPSVMKEGWTPRTIIPGNLSEPSVLETVLQLAQSMRLSFQAVNENTMVLTTFESSARRVDLEVYPISKLLAGAFNEKQIIRLVNNSMGSQLQSNTIRYVYQPNCQCIVVLAPQNIQRQIEALLDQLGGI